MTQRNKLLESENRLLMSETDQLRQVGLPETLFVALIVPSTGVEGS